MFIILLLCCTALLHATQVLFTKLYNHNYLGNEKAAPFVFSVFSGIALGILTFAIGGFKFSPSALTVLLACCKAILVLMFNVSEINAVSRGSFAIMSVFMHGGGIVVPMVVSVLFLNQGLTLPQGIAVAVLIGSLFLLNSSGMKGEKPKRGYWAWCIVLALANGGCGSMMTLQANLMGGRERGEMIIISNAVAVLFALICLVFVRKKKMFGDFKINKRSAFWFGAYAIVAVIAANLYLYAFAHGNTTVVASVDIGGALVLSALFALLVFKEKLTKLQWLGMFTSISAIVILSIF